MLGIESCLLSGSILDLLCQKPKNKNIDSGPAVSPSCGKDVDYLSEEELHLSLLVRSSVPRYFHLSLSTGQSTNLE